MARYFVTGYARWIIAATNGDPDAKEVSPKFAKKLAPDKIAEGRKLSREMLIENPKLLNK